MSPPSDRGFTTSIDPHYMTARLVLRDAAAAQEICKRDLISVLEQQSIVCTPEDAFRCFMGTELEMLAIGDCVLRKEDQDATPRQDYRAEMSPD